MEKDILAATLSELLKLLSTNIRFCIIASNNWLEFQYQLNKS